MFFRLIAISACFCVLPALAVTTSSPPNTCEAESLSDECSALYRQLKRLSRNGSAEASTLLAYMHLNGEQGVEKDPQRAIRLFEKAARRNAPVAQFELARHLLEGEHIQANPEKAMRLLDAAANRGYAAARLVHHMLLLDDPDTPATEKPALIERIKTLDLAYPEYANHFLGQYYLQQGRKALAADYLRQASELGHPRAQKLLKTHFPNVPVNDSAFNDSGVERIEVSAASVDLVEAAREIINYAKRNSLFNRKHTGSRIPGRSCEFDASCFVFSGRNQIDRFMGIIPGG